MTPLFEGSVSVDAKLTLDKSQTFKDYLRGLAGKRIQLTVEKIKHSRTNNQNKYYWGVVVKLISQHTGHDPEQIHELLKQMFSPKWHFVRSFQPQAQKVILDEVSGIPTSTARLDTIEFVEYTERCRLWANDFLGLSIPLPGEVDINN
jgi:hypothetical protein